MKKETTKFFLLGILVLLSMNFISSTHPFVSQSSGDLNIESSKINLIPANQSHTFHFHVFNTTNFITNSTGQCGFTMMIQNGSVQYKNQNIPYFQQSENEWEVTLNAGNFSSLGQYSFATECNTSSQVGLISSSLLVTPNGVELDTSKSIVYIGFLIILIFTFVLSTIGGILIPWKHKRNEETGEIVSVNDFRYLKVFFFVMDYLLMMFLFGLSYKLFNEANILGFTNFFYYGYQLFENLLIPLAIALVIIFVLIFLNNQKIKSNLELGIKE